MLLLLLLALAAPAAPAAPASSPASLHVVALLSSPSRAHRAWAQPLVAELQRVGHDVDVLVMQPREQKPSRVHALQERLTWGHRNLSAPQRVRAALALGRELSESLLQSKELATALEEWRPADVLLADYWLTDAALTYSWERLGRPACVLLSPLAVTPPWVRRLVGVPPHLEADTLLGRVGELAHLLLEDWKYHWQHLPVERDLWAARLNGAVPQPRVDLVLANELPGLFPERPSNPRVLGVGGMRMSAPTPQHGHGGAAKEIILVEVDRKADRIMDAIAESLNSLHHFVVVFVDRDRWLKYAIAENSFVDWSDDQSCRSDCYFGTSRPKLAVWVGHAPLALAAALTGTPQVAVPLSQDEDVLAARLEEAGAAVVVDAFDFTAEKLRGAIERAASCLRMRGAAHNLSLSLKDSLQPLERARLAVEAVAAAAVRAGDVGADDPRVARLRPRSLLQLMHLDALLGLALLAGLTLAACVALCTLLFTLLCYRKKYAVKLKRS